MLHDLLGTMQGGAPMSFLAWVIECIGYKIRPYDMLADQRRWFWQEREHCGVKR